MDTTGREGDGYDGKGRGRDGEGAGVSKRTARKDGGSLSQSTRETGSGVPRQSRVPAFAEAAGKELGSAGFSMPGSENSLRASHLET